jgi:protein-disulfide isomerase
MLNKYFGVIATVALTLSPVAVFAQETQVNSQGASNSGVASGAGNLVIQNTDQDSLQHQTDVDGYYHGNDPQLQINKQDASNSGAAVGYGNDLIQNVDQDSVQSQFGY